MKHPFYLQMLMAILAFFIIACEEEDVPIQKQYSDNGTYNPDSYFPMVNGAV
ncbi:MAG: hypothetical protein LPK45_05115 [Bacteroidota bacterium]|nr:hypothetical protein [Bacteroidota bacterium]MDX5430440.1 hypothetical protein [Bacteroidota bacterium]MDX5469199.1 hypothetical protein [Bacteroidota bacterium]